jgi:hypothetical protein
MMRFSSGNPTRHRKALDVIAARRLVDAPGWTWAEGMLALADDRDLPHGMRITGRSSRGRVIHSRRPRVPALDDPATVGAILAVLGDLYLADCVLEHRERAWRVVYPSGSEAWLDVSGWRASAGEALAVAMERAG